MKKIPTMFERDWEGTRLVIDKLAPGCEWVLVEGLATEKIDGTSCLVRDGKLYKRYDCKKGKTPPPGWEKCEDEPDPITGHWPGWVPVGDGPEDKWHREAFDTSLPNSTYELVGPRVQGNPYGLARHIFRPHGERIFYGIPRTFNELRQWLADRPQYEGIVFWRNLADPDCDKCKIKRRDFGLPWPVKGVK